MNLMLSAMEYPLILSIGDMACRDQITLSFATGNTTTAEDNVDKDIMGRRINMGMSIVRMRWDYED